MLEEELSNRVTMGPRPVQQAPLRVLIGANMPAALIEMAYLTNPEQEKVARDRGVPVSRGAGDLRRRRALPRLPRRTVAP